MPCTRNLSTKSLPRSGSILALACRGDGCCKMVGNPARPSDPDATWPTSAQGGVEGRAKFRRVLFISCELTLERSASSGVLIEINHNTSPRAGRNARAHVPFGNLHKCQECPNLECPCRVCGVTVAARALNLRLNLRTSTRERRFPPFATGGSGACGARQRLTGDTGHSSDQRVHALLGLRGSRPLHTTMIMYCTGGSPAFLAVKSCTLIF